MEHFLRGEDDGQRAILVLEDDMWAWNLSFLQDWVWQIGCYGVLRIVCYGFLQGMDIAET